MSNLTVRNRAERLPLGLPDAFFDRDAQVLAQDLLGKVIRHRVGDLWLSARIIETEAYYLEERGSHASLGLCTLLPTDAVTAASPAPSLQQSQQQHHPIL